MDRIRVAAVQSGVDPRWTPAEWANHLRWQLSICREAGASIAVFPAWIGAYQESYPHGFPEGALGTFVRLLGDLAREARLHLVPGTLPVRGGDGVRLRSFLLAPSGDLLGDQDQICPPPGYVPGRSLATFPTTLGRLGIIVDADVMVPEIARILALQGADLFCIPLALAQPTSTWRQAAGAWQVVQANQVPAVEACLVGEFGGRSYAGRSRVTATVEMTGDGTGVVVEARSPVDTEVVAGELDYVALTSARASFPIFDSFNVPLYRRRMAEAYRKLASFAPAPALAPVAVPAADAGSQEADRSGED